MSEYVWSRRMKIARALPAAALALLAAACGSSGTVTAPGAEPQLATASPAGGEVSAASVCSRVNATLATIKRDMAPAESGPSGGSLPAIRAALRRDQPAWNAQLTAEAAQAAPGLAAHLSVLSAGWSAAAGASSASVAVLTSGLVQAARAARAVRTDCPQ